MRYYYTKKELYDEINNLRAYLEINKNSYPLNMPNICKEQVIAKLEEIPFKTPGLKGIANISNDENDPDIILLNSNLNEQEQNFYCTHEIMHLSLHRNYKTKTFNCFEKVLPHQNNFIEWHANEGGAEFLVPYRQLLPLIQENSSNLKSWNGIWKLRDDLAEHFQVTSSVMAVRFESLKYEIGQFINGCNIDNLKIISSAKQEALGIKTKSLNDIAYDYIAWECSEHVSDYEKELLDDLKLGE